MTRDEINEWRRRFDSAKSDSERVKLLQELDDRLAVLRGLVPA